MNKLIAAICILISSIVALALIVILIAGITGHSLFNWGMGRLSFYTGGESKLIKEESVVLSDYENFTLDVKSHKVYISTTNSDKLTVRQYGAANSGGNELFTMRKNGNSVSVDMRDRNVRIMFFYWANEYIEIEIPESWHGDVDMKTSSGGITIEDNFEWKDVSLRCTSGGISIESELKGRDVSISASSGGISLKSLIKADNLSVKVTSGGIKTEGLEAESVDIESSSGGMSLRNTVKAGDLRLKCHSGAIKTELLETETFNIESSSGGMKIKELTGQGKINSTSGGIKIDMLIPSGNVEIRASSGGILADVPSDLAHFINSRATSGSVHINER